MNAAVRSAVLRILCGGCLLPAGATAGTPPTSPAAATILGEVDIQSIRESLDAGFVADAGDEKSAWETFRHRLESYPEWLSSDRSPAQVALNLSPREEEAFACLKHAAFFSWGAVGFTRLPALEPHAVALLARSPVAARAFRLLLTEATPAGQMHALYGLERVDRADFERAVAPYLSRGDPDEPRLMVLRQRGCLVEAVDAAAGARQVFLGWYDPAYTAEQRAALATRFRSLQQPERHP